MGIPTAPAPQPRGRVLLYGWNNCGSHLNAGLINHTKARRSITYCDGVEFRKSNTTILSVPRKCHRPPPFSANNNVGARTGGTPLAPTFIPTEPSKARIIQIEHMGHPRHCGGCAAAASLSSKRPINCRGNFTPECHSKNRPLPVVQYHNQELLLRKSRGASAVYTCCELCFTGTLGKPCYKQCGFPHNAGASQERLYAHFCTL